MKAALTLFALGLSLAICRSADATPPCQQVQAKGVGQDHGNGTTTAAIVGGPLSGTSTASFAIVAVVNGVATLDGHVDFATSSGDLTVQVTGSFDLTTGKFNVSGPVIQGTGSLAGASGTLFFQGVEDFSTGQFSEKVSGKICRGVEC